MGYRPSVKSRWLDIDSPRIIIILSYVKQCSKGKGSHEEKEKKSIPSWSLPFLYVASQQLNHSPGNNSRGSYGCAYKHFARTSIMHKRSKGIRGCGSKRSPFPCGSTLKQYKNPPAMKATCTLKKLMSKDEMLMSLYVHLLGLYNYYNY